MSLILVFNTVISSNSNNHITTNNFEAEQIIIKVECLYGCKATWKSAGYVSQLIEVPDLGEVEGETKRIILGTKLIKFDSLGYSYKLNLTINQWIPQAEIKIYTT